MQSSTSSRGTVSFQSDKLVYYASIFVYEPAQKNNFINYQASLHNVESKSPNENEITHMIIKNSRLIIVIIGSNLFPGGSDNKLQTFLKMSDEEQRNVFTNVRSKTSSDLLYRKNKLKSISDYSLRS